jgi:hypothetical protein
MKNIRRTIALAAALLAVFTSSGAAAQRVAGSTLRAGEEIIVMQSSSGEELRGRLVELSPTTLALLVNGRRVEVPMDTVLRIDGTHDSVRNGAIIGAAFFGGMCALACGQGLNNIDELPRAVLINTAYGALIGASLDAMHKGRSPIYIKTAGKSGSALQVRLRF